MSVRLRGFSRLQNGNVNTSNVAEKHASILSWLRVEESDA